MLTLKVRLLEKYNIQHIQKYKCQKSKYVIKK